MMRICLYDQRTCTVESSPLESRVPLVTKHLRNHNITRIMSATMNVTTPVFTAKEIKCLEEDGIFQPLPPGAPARCNRKASDSMMSSLLIGSLFGG